MAKLPYFKFYANEWQSDESVRLMTMEARGLYISMLAYAWNEGSIPDDSAKCARLFGISRRKFDKLFDEVSTKFERKSGRIFNKRLEKERDKVDDRSAINQANGQAGGRKTQKIRRERQANGQANAKAFATNSLDQNQSIIESESESESESDKESTPHPYVDPVIWSGEIHGLKPDPIMYIGVLEAFSKHIKSVPPSSANQHLVHTAFESGLTKAEIWGAIKRQGDAYDSENTENRYRSGTRAFFDPDNIRHIISDKFAPRGRQGPKNQPQGKSALAKLKEGLK